MKVKIIQNGTHQNIIGTKYYIIDIPYIVELRIGLKTYIIVVPKGFITDLGSIPSIFFFFDKSRYIFYILHDYLYSLVGKIVNIYGKLNYNQNLADEILFNGLGIEGMNNTGRVLVLSGLDIGGRFNYKKENKEISRLKKTLNCN